MTSLEVRRDKSCDATLYQCQASNSEGTRETIIKSKLSKKCGFFAKCQYLYYILFRIDLILETDKWHRLQRLAFIYYFISRLNNSTFKALYQYILVSFTTWLIIGGVVLFLLIIIIIICCCCCCCSRNKKKREVAYQREVLRQVSGIVVRYQSINQSKSLFDL